MRVFILFLKKQRVPPYHTHTLNRFLWCAVCRRRALCAPLRVCHPTKVASVDATDDRRAVGRAVFQRAGCGAGKLTVDLVPFATFPSAAAAPQQPPPPAQLELNARVFGQPLRLDVLQTVVKWQLAIRRAGTASTKTIHEVSGSGKKMRPQKGGGTSRCGHKRPPHWRGGAVAHGPR